ncbi:MAG: hypothetical protein MZU91_12240 [Desulfosudis oleivorans]|nr:hypothetical protein [Desulfosudis oleivorans]
MVRIGQANINSKELKAFRVPVPRWRSSWTFESDGGRWALLATQQSSALATAVATFDALLSKGFDRSLFVMLDSLTATRFDRRMTKGRTGPFLLECETVAGDAVEVVAKFNGPQLPVEGLVREALCAMLAADLGLPVPACYCVHLQPDFLAAVASTHGAEAAVLAAAVPVGFGSAKLPPGFSAWMPGRSIPKGMQQGAAEIYAFDLLVQNPDRRPDNPNLQVQGRALRDLRSRTGPRHRRHPVLAPAMGAGRAGGPGRAGPPRAAPGTARLRPRLCAHDRRLGGRRRWPACGLPGQRRRPSGRPRPRRLALPGPGVV